MIDGREQCVGESLAGLITIFGPFGKTTFDHMTNALRDSAGERNVRRFGDRSHQGLIV